MVFSVSADLKKIYLPTPLKQQARAQSTQAEGRVSESASHFTRSYGMEGAAASAAPQLAQDAAEVADLPSSN